MSYNETDPISLEPFTDNSRRIVFYYNGSSVHYDFDVFYNNIKSIKVIPHTGQPFTERFKEQFNAICYKFHKPPAFKVFKSKDTYEDNKQDKPDILIIVILTTIISALSVLIFLIFQTLVQV